ncbi:hypothetical protein [Sinorhizobium americanum]|nr:hypothetical protein [Sinorhizobium americanum]
MAGWSRSIFQAGRAIAKILDRCEMYLTPADDPAKAFREFGNLGAAMSLQDVLAISLFQLLERAWFRQCGFPLLQPSRGGQPTFERLRLDCGAISHYSDLRSI